MTPHRVAERFVAMANGEKVNALGLTIRVAQIILPLLVTAIALYVTLQIRVVTVKYDERFDAFDQRVGRNEKLIGANTIHSSNDDDHMPADVKFGTFATKDELRIAQEHIEEKAEIRHEEVIRRFDAIEAKLP